MIRYILVDDEPKILKRVHVKIESIAKDYDLKHIKSYDSSKKAFQEINEDDYDLLIVDFEMPVYNGIELAQKIATNKKIIFLTSTTNNGPKMMNALTVSGYLSKPFDIEEFEDILKNKIIDKINPTSTYQKGDMVSLSISKNRHIGIYPEDILFISTALISTGYKIIGDKIVKTKKPEGNFVHFYGKDSKLLQETIRKTISDLETELGHLGFIRINQSTLININHYKDLENRNLELYNCKEPFKVSEKEKIPFLNKLEKHKINKH